MKKVLIFVIIFILSIDLFSPEVPYEVRENISTTTLKYVDYYNQYRLVINNIKNFEGLSLTPYWDVKQYSIGYGHAIKSYEKFTIITEKEAELLLKLDFNNCISHVEKLTNLNRYDDRNKVLALASLVYNIGIGNFQNSTLLEKLNSNQCINYEFLRWVKIKQGDKYITSKHLIERRKVELSLYNT